MPSALHILGMYLGNHPIARLNRPADALRLPEADAEKLSQILHQALLQNQKGFRMTASIGGLSPLDLEWLSGRASASHPA